jgi:hypothetical protein
MFRFTEHRTFSRGPQDRRRASEGLVDYTFPERVTSYSRYWKSFATLSLSKLKQSFAGVVKCPHRTGKGEVLEWQGAKSERIEP